MTQAQTAAESWLREVTTPLGQARVACRQCSLHGICAVLESDQDDRSFVQRSRVGSGKTLFRAGDRFQGVYAVTSGAIKTHAHLGQNATQVVDFHFPGDTVGLEVIDRGEYTYTAQALTETLVCRIDPGRAPALAERQRDVQTEVIRALGEQLRHEQSLSILLRTQTAEQRIATFLLSLAGPSLWTHTRGVDLQLPMSRKDIANYLGIAVETLCRLFKRMQEDGLLESQGRRVRLANIDALSAIARPAPQTDDDSCPA